MSETSLVVRVFQHDFPIRRQYSAGHVVTEAEAIALNQLLVENIRNNVYSWVAREAKNNSVLTAEQQAYLTERISNYADNYIFKSRIRSQRPNPFELAVRELARQHAEAWGNQQGHQPNSPEVQDKYMELRKHAAIYEEARDLILRRQSIVSTAIEGLVL